MIHGLLGEPVSSFFESLSGSNMHEWIKAVFTLAIVCRLLYLSKWIRSNYKNK